MRAISRTVCGLLLAGPLLAQADEAKFLAAAADRLHDHAKKCFDAKFHREARDLWREVIGEYATDHEAARKALGYVKVGASWAPDSRFTYPDRDEPNPAVARVLAKQFESIAKDLGAGHRAQGEAVLAAGNPERAQWHFQRMQRFALGDVPIGKSESKSGGKPGGVPSFGAEVELKMLERSRAIDRWIVEYGEKSFPVSPITESPPKFFQNAKLSVRGFATEHFEVWGDWEDDMLGKCAMDAERAFAFCGEIFAGMKEFAWRTKGRVRFGLFKTKEAWADAIRANSASFESSQLDFILKNTGAASVPGETIPLFVGGFEQVEIARDYCVRKTVHQYVGFRSDALDEGIGHAVVGWFFGENLIFTVAQERDDGRTSTGTKDTRFNLPDLSVWKELAENIAWDRADTPATKLPSIRASDMSNEQRIKSWSFCDYVLRRDPRILRWLDNTNRGGSRVAETEVEAQFKENSAGESIVAIDRDWRRYWTEDSALMRAIRNKELSIESVSKRAPELLGAFNEVRRLYEQPKVGWSADYSADCRQHGRYLETNKGERGAEKEHTQEIDKKGGTLTGRAFAPLALVDTAVADPVKNVQAWMHLPGYRDAILDPSLSVVGLWAEGKMVVVDVTRGRDPLVSKATWFPFGVPPGSALPSTPQRGIMVPHEVPLAPLGAEVAAFLREKGGKLGKTIGYPITMHLFQSGSLPTRETVTCRVMKDGKTEVEGALIITSRGSSRRHSAPGLIVFYPFAPLDRGAAYTVEWSWEKGGMQPPARYQFFTQ
ncbi:MAG: CAP domain-containing protein [Planctomycetota bacterium]